MYITLGTASFTYCSGFTNAGPPCWQKNFPFTRTLKLDLGPVARILTTGDPSPFLMTWQPNCM